MKTKIIIIISSLIMIGILLVGYRMYNDSKKVEGEKEVTLVIEDKTYKYQTDAETLGELLDEIEDIDFVLSGKKTDQYGRYLLEIDEKGSDFDNGVYWLYESSTNSECLKAGYCPGVDLIAIFDKDKFEFNYIGELSE